MDTQQTIDRFSENGHESENIYVRKGMTADLQLFAPGRANRESIRSRCDTLISTYEQEGFDGLSSLSFEHSYILRDRQSGRTMAWRGAVDGVPLFYRQTDSKEWIVSTDISGLCSTSYTPDLDISSVYQFLIFQYLPSPRTLLKGIAKVRPGCSILFDRSGELIEVEKPILTYLPSEESDVHDRCTELLQTIYSDLKGVLAGKAGLFCSGGIDSTTNAIRCHQSDVDFVLLTAGFKGSEWDEVPYAEMVQNQTKRPHWIHRAENVTPDHLDRIARALKEPICDRSIIPSALLVGSYPDDLTDLVSGEGGDELWGPPRRWSFNSANRRSDREFHALSRRYLENAACMTRDERLSLFSDLEVAGSIETNSVSALSSIATLSGAQDEFQALKAIQTATWLPENVVAKDRAVASIRGIGVHFPLASAAARNFIAGLSADAHFTWCSDKTLLRSQLVGSVPDGILEKRKHKFKVPPDIWFHKSTHERLLDRFNSGTNNLDQMLVKAKLENVAKRALLGEAVNDRAIWGIYVLLAWHENLVSAARNRRN
ncbi:asparagine synthase-related protein [Allorhizobium undicola]|uniref:asparagine synthase-related protein n=1 Tax=Allorhizobium undicola TaxID=78527 RepID=UPI000489A785|nr:asparagine synthase-related protein [Allorhizobium undicola]